MPRDHRLIATLATLGALSLAALAPAATTKRFEGRVKGAGPISFQLTGSSVKRLRASVSVACASSSGGRSETYLLAPAGSAKLDKRGRFILRFAKDKQTGGPFPLYKIKAAVRGKVSGRSSSGTMEVTYYKNQVVGGRLILMGCGTGRLSWTAKRK